MRALRARGSLAVASASWLRDYHAPFPAQVLVRAPDARRYLIFSAYADGILSPFGQRPYPPYDTPADAPAFHEAYARTLHAQANAARPGWGQPISPQACVDECWRVLCPGANPRRGEPCRACTGPWDQGRAQQQQQEEERCAYVPDNSGPNEEDRCARFMANALRPTVDDGACPVMNSAMDEGWRAYCVRWYKSGVAKAAFGECLNAQGFPCSERVLFGGSAARDRGGG